jgi:hypothetical protein
VATDPQQTIKLT